jgi:hypothetical protein
MTVEELKEKLSSKKSSDRLRAAKQICKEKTFELSENLYDAYLKEKQDKRTWESQSQMIKTLGVLDFKKALPLVEEIVNENIPHDMITICAATTFVQLKRKSIQDAQPVLELLKFGSTSVIHGALYVLAIDKMIPTSNAIEEIIKICWDINKHKDRTGREYGLVDPRRYLAIACAGWEKELTTAFLKHCIETAYDINNFGKAVENANLINDCKMSLKGKYPKVY